MKIIAQLITLVQEVIKKQLQSLFSGIPIAFEDGKSCIFVLVKDLSKDIEDFILAGKPGITELHLLSKEQSQELQKYCKRLGLKCSFHSQMLEYMRCKAEIIYPQISNPVAGLKVALIPWFVLPGRPFPIFVYTYGIWHYTTGEQTSMRLSAEETRDLFGIGSFNKSTLSRSIKAMEGFLNISAIDRPLSTNEPKISPTDELIIHIPELLITCPTIESLEKAFGIKSVPLPPPVNRKVEIANIMSNIPEGLRVAVNSKNIIKKGHLVTRHNRQPQKSTESCTKHKTDFVETPEKKRIRLEFIAICKAMVLDAAIGFHRFLISTTNFKNPFSCNDVIMQN